MICIIASNFQSALIFAKSQLLEPDEWFYPDDIRNLQKETNFHVLISPSAHTLQPQFFEKLFRIAKERGRIGRK